MNDVSNVQIFRYETTDFNSTIKTNVPESKFDVLLKEKWNYAENNGILRYKLNIKEWKILEGSYKFLAQLNLDRASNRRAPECIDSMSKPFDANGFNFTKLPAKEVFIDLGNGDGNDVIVANVSPLEWGHFLFLPQRLRCLPQRMTEWSLSQALELMLLSNSQYFRVIFNSLCANASVNHLHWHLYYLKHQMPLEHIELQQFEGPLSALTNFPSKGFCLKLSSFPDRDYRKLASWAFLVINHLQQNNVAHNVFVTRARTDPDEKIWNDIRIYIWARKSSTRSHEQEKNIEDIVPAVCELFGHLSVRTEEGYRNLSEEKAVRLLTDITTEVFASIQQSVKKIIVDRMNLGIKET